MIRQALREKGWTRFWLVLLRDQTRLDGRRTLEHQMAGLELRAPQRQAQHLTQLPDEVDPERFPHVLGEILEVGLVLHGEHDGGDAARTAPSTFSLTPPIGSTRPRNVISPVMARSWRAGRRDSAETSAVAIVTPAEGPSLGMAPAEIGRAHV